jgi:hypothetical protein
MSDIEVFLCTGLATLTVVIAYLLVEVRNTKRTAIYACVRLSMIVKRNHLQEVLKDYE